MPYHIIVLGDSYIKYLVFSIERVVSKQFLFPIALFTILDSQITFSVISPIMKNGVDEGSIETKFVPKFYVRSVCSIVSIYGSKDVTLTSTPPHLPVVAEVTAKVSVVTGYYDL